jgi:hypothetical protein
VTVRNRKCRKSGQITVSGAVLMIPIIMRMVVIIRSGIAGWPIVITAGQRDGEAAQDEDDVDSAHASPPDVILCRADMGIFHEGSILDHHRR